MTRYEDCGNPPIVLCPFKPHGEHRTIEVGNNTPHKIELRRGEECVSVLVQSTGEGFVRLTLDGSNPTQDRGFRITSTMPPIELNLCGNTVITFIGSKNKGCLVDIQLGE